MTNKDRATWLATLAQTAQNGCPDTAHLNGPKMTPIEWLVVAKRLGVILAADPALELTGKFTQDGYEPGETDVFHEYIRGVLHPYGVYVLDLKDWGSRPPDGCYVSGTVSRIIDAVINTVVTQHNPGRGPNMHVYDWGLEAADALAKAYSEEKSKALANSIAAEKSLKP